MLKYEQWANRKGLRVSAGPDTGQVTERLTRYDYDKGPMYFLGQQIVKVMQDSGYPAFIWNCYRSPQEQNEYFARGTSKARAWQSPHQFYEAVDILHPERYWQTSPDYWEQLATATRIVAERFEVELEHGHYWSFVDSAHIELKDWRTFRDRMRARWRVSMEMWEEARAEDPMHPEPMPQPSKPNLHELQGRFNEVLPKVWAQHVRGTPEPNPAEFTTRRQRQRTT